MGRKKKKGSAAAAEEDPSAPPAPLDGSELADETGDAEGDETPEEGAPEVLAGATQTAGDPSAPPCAECGSVDPCDHLRTGEALPAGSGPRVEVASAVVPSGGSATLEATLGDEGAPPAEALGGRVASPELHALAVRLYDALMAAAVEEGTPGLPPPFEELDKRSRRTWLNFAERVRGMGAAVPPSPDAPVRCRALDTIGLPARAATDEHGKPVLRVRAGAVCLVRPDVYARSKKHLERL